MMVVRLYHNADSVIFFKNNKILIQKDLILYVYWAVYILIWAFLYSVDMDYCQSLFFKKNGIFMYIYWIYDQFFTKEQDNTNTDKNPMEWHMISYLQAISKQNWADGGWVLFSTD
jgi:hypothetical protein